MQDAGIRIAHSLAVFEMRDSSPTVNDGHAPASGASCCRAETGSLMRAKKNLKTLDIKTGVADVRAAEPSR